MGQERSVMSVSDWAGSVSDWQQALEGLKGFIASAFKRSWKRASAGVFIDGPLSGAERKTGWMLAEEAGLARPLPDPVSAGPVVMVCGCAKRAHSELCP
jgi:hypothetical protein